MIKPESHEDAHGALRRQAQPGELPDGWRWAQLAEVARVFAGSAAPQGDECFNADGPPFVRVSDLSPTRRMTCLVEARDKLSDKALGECSLVLAREGTVVFPKSGAAIATNSRAILGRDAYIVSHLMAIEPTDEVASSWLYWSLCQVDMRDCSDNSAYPSLKQSTVQRIRIPLPPLGEQKRIVAILNKEMAEVERARAAAEAQLEAAKALPAAYLRAVFNSPKAGTWPRKGLAEVCTDIADGTHVTPTYVSGGIPFLSVKDVKENALSFNDCRFITKEEHEYLCRRCKPERGDVLYTKVGTTGIAKMVDVDREFSIFVSVALLKLKPAVLPEYVEKVLNAPIARAQAENLTQGMANRNLVLQDVSASRFPCRQ